MLNLYKKKCEVHECQSVGAKLRRGRILCAWATKKHDSWGICRDKIYPTVKLNSYMHLGLTKKQYFSFFKYCFLFNYKS